MQRPRRLITSAATILCAVLAASAVAAQPAAAVPRLTTANQSYLVVLDDNIENRITCAKHPYNFQNLLNYLGKRPYAPDIFTVQQVSGKANNGKPDALRSSADEIAADLGKSVGAPAGTYKALVAIANPAEFYPNEPAGTCVKQKTHQTNAIIYRADRFDVVFSDTWISNGTKSCANLVGAARDRSVNLKARLRDKLTGKYVNVGSFHWPTKGDPTYGELCADVNRKQAALALTNLDKKYESVQKGASLNILGGDANVNTLEKSWWTQITGGDHYLDTMCDKEHCDLAFDTLYDDKGELKARFDYLLAKGSHGVAYADTISGTAAGGQYSQHRALLAHINY
jgi:hypothetical protein